MSADSPSRLRRLLALGGPEWAPLEHPAGVGLPSSEQRKLNPGPPAPEAEDGR